MDPSPFVEQARARISRFEEAFKGCNILQDIIAESMFLTLTGTDTSAARAAIATLFAKALKSFNGLRLLAALGYGEDALIVTRSLVNLSFVAGYICSSGGDPEERAFAWIANGFVAQREFIERDLGLPLPDHLLKDVDWGKIAEYTRKREREREAGNRQEVWPRSVSDLAKGAGMGELYRQAYRFMSSPEHSDAWGVDTYFRAWGDRQMHLDVNPSDERVSLALAIAAQAMANVFVKFCNTFEIPYSVERIRQIGSYFGDEEEPETNA